MRPKRPASMSAMSESSAAASTSSVSAVEVGQASPGRQGAPDGARAGGHDQGCGDAEPPVRGRHPRILRVGRVHIVIRIDNMHISDHVESGHIALGPSLETAPQTPDRAHH